MENAKFVLKPLMWNNKNYKKPSGEKVWSGWAKKHGFGAEEWNNSPRMISADREQRYFHTEAGDKIKEKMREFNDKFMIFMIASHQGKQWLLGMAGKATFIPTDCGKAAKIVSEVQLDKFGRDDLLKVETVRTIYKSEEEFDAFWNGPKGVKAMTFWSCCSCNFLWLCHPVSIEASKITGKKKFCQMHGNYQNLDYNEAKNIICYVPKNERTEEWRALFRLVDGAAA